MEDESTTEDYDLYVVHVSYRIFNQNNLAKRNWNGTMKCCFCVKDESIEHQFISYFFAKLVWCIVHMTSNISPSTNIMDLSGNCLHGDDEANKV